jgi:hypothetical protein
MATVISYFEVAADAARRHARQIPVIDYTERYMHDVHSAVAAFDTAITNTTSLARLAQLEERATAFETLWAQIREQARDKSLAIERLDGLFKEGA